MLQKWGGTVAHRGFCHLHHPAFLLTLPLTTSLLLAGFSSGCGTTSLSEEVSLGWAEAVHSCFHLPPSRALLRMLRPPVFEGVPLGYHWCQSSVSSMIGDCESSSPYFQMKGFLSVCPLKLKFLSQIQEKGLQRITITCGRN